MSFPLILEMEDELDQLVTNPDILLSLLHQYWGFRCICASSVCMCGGVCICMCTSECELMHICMDMEVRGYPESSLSLSALFI